MSSMFAFELGVKIQQTNVKVQKVDGTTLKIYETVVSFFFISDKDDR